MNKEEFIKELKKLEVPVKNIDMLDIYYKYLNEYNKHTNLTSITEEKDVYLKHFYDSLTICKTVDLNKFESLLDIGTGAGFPGLVLKIFYPHLKVTLLDSNGKKIKFLENLSQKLNIEVNIVNERSEDYIKEKRESFDIVTSRAVADLSILLELALPFVKKGGYFIPLKGEVTKELNDSQNALSILKGKIIKKEEFFLPIENSKRTILLIEKTDKNNIKYPRQFNQIKRKPL
ncbi:MAG TPA: 16S rRNA (guanine(527)-N(7))-methyltransferase RsmG [Mollicutes bacterium]|nr:16S rRNA (guanine(527)-N(7))-methyltransferase RsmG [Mollicutes bacterium]